MTLQVDPDPSLQVLAARSMLDRLDAMAARVKGVTTARDVEDVHQMRVASRRLRAALRQFRHEFPEGSVKSWNRIVRRVTRRLGPARDLDVQILFVRDHLEHLEDGGLRPGVRRLLLRWKQKRERLQPKVRRAMEDLSASGLFDDLGGTLRRILTHARLENVPDRSEAVRERARTSVRSEVESLLSFETFVPQPERAEELHRMRIAAKRLRYTLELFAPVYDGALDDHVKRIKRIQTLLGDLHDCDVWIELLPRFAERERRRMQKFQGSTRGYAKIRKGVDHLREDRTRERRAVYRGFVEAWNELETIGEWERLLDAVLQAPPPEAERHDAGARSNVREIGSRTGGSQETA
jgi:CHAD domain-containing protein